MVNDDPSSDILLVGAHTCGNSGLCRSYITDSKRERKIVKICVVGNIGSGAQTQGHPQQTFLINFWWLCRGIARALPGIAGVLRFILIYSF